MKKQIKKKKWNIPLLIIGGCVGFILMGVLIGMMSGDSSNSNVNSVDTGTEGKLYLEGTTLIPVCTTRAYLEELVDTVVAKDTIGYKNLIYSSKCYMAPTLEPYGDVLVLDKTLGMTKIRFTNTEAIHYGETAWTYTEYITID